MPEKWDCFELRCDSINFNNYENNSGGFADSVVTYKNMLVIATLFLGQNYQKMTQLEILINLN